MPKAPINFYADAIRMAFAIIKSKLSPIYSKSCMTETPLERLYDAFSVSSGRREWVWQREREQNALTNWIQYSSNICAEGWNWNSFDFALNFVINCFRSSIRKATMVVMMMVYNTPNSRTVHSRGADDEDIVEPNIRQFMHPSVRATTAESSAPLPKRMKSK